jgi:hypothetical protein
MVDFYGDYYDETPATDMHSLCYTGKLNEIHKVDKKQINTVLNQFVTVKPNRMERDPSSSYLSNATLLAVAIKGERKDIIEYLLSVGADPNITCSYYATAASATDGITECNALQLYLFKPARNERRSIFDTTNYEATREYEKRKKMERKWIIYRLLRAGANIYWRARSSHSFSYYTECADDPGEHGETHHGMLSSEEIADMYDLGTIFRAALMMGKVTPIPQVYDVDFIFQ